MKEIAAITGGTSGLGKGFVERFVKDGYQVVFCGRNEEKGAAISAATGAEFIIADVTKAEQVEAFFGAIKAKYGRLDVLINNAGTVTPSGKQGDVPLDLYHSTMDVNINGAWYVAKYGVKLMEQQDGGGGRIVNISSIGGMSGICAKGGTSHYGVSKYALIGMTKIMALEYAHLKIRINSVAPTAIETDMVRTYIENSDDKEAARAIVAGMNPMVGPGDPLPQPEDVAGAVAFLCGPDAKFINGVVLPVDGGQTCN